MTIWQIFGLWIATSCIGGTAFAGLNFYRSRPSRNPQQRVSQNDGEGWGDIGVVHHGEAGK